MYVEKRFSFLTQKRKSRRLWSYSHLVMFSRYRNSLGAPRQGVHALRIPIVDLAVVDVALTCVAIKALVDHSSLSMTQATAILVIAGVVAHRLFAVDAMWLR